MAVQLRKIECRWCGQVFFACQRCDFGRRYCGEPCRNAAKQRNDRRARRDYARSDKGRQNNLERQHRFREKRRTARNSKGKQESVTDRSSQLGLLGVSCAHDATPAEFDHTEQPPTTPPTQRPALVHRTFSQPSDDRCEPEATKEAAEQAARAASQESGRPVRVAQCRFCGAWGVVLEADAARGRFRRRSHGRHMNPRRKE